MIRLLLVVLCFVSLGGCASMDPYYETPEQKALAKSYNQLGRAMRQQGLTLADVPPSPYQYPTGFHCTSSRLGIFTNTDCY